MEIDDINEEQSIEKLISQIQIKLISEILNSNPKREINPKFYFSDIDVNHAKLKIKVDDKCFNVSSQRTCLEVLLFDQHANNSGICIIQEIDS